MKIVKKIFTLSTSAILGLSFCAGTAFASRVSTDDSKIVKPTPINTRPYGQLRRSPRMDFLNQETRISDDFSIEDFIRSNSASRSPLIYNDLEDVRYFNLYLSIMKSINRDR